MNIRKTFQNRSWAGFTFTATAMSLIMSGLSGCAVFKRSSSNSAGEPEVVQVLAPPTATTDVAVSVVQGASQKSGAAASSLLVDRQDLKSFEKISIELPFADVAVASHASTKKGSLRVQLLKGDAATCKTYVVDEGGVLMLSDKPESATSHASISAMAKFIARTVFPTNAKCRYAVELGLRESAPLSVLLTRGSVAIENWSEPSTIKLEWGDIDVGSIGALDVNCGRCTLAGEGVSGALRFKMENGNVGLSGLTGSAEGQTLGDTILNWRRLKSDASVKVSSRAGDVILTFPRGSALNLDLNALRGDVSQPKENANHANGIPVQATADTGNVKIYFASAKSEETSSQ